MAKVTIGFSISVKKINLILILYFLCFNLYSQNFETTYITLNEKDDLIIAVKDFPNKMNWEDANRACEKLGYGWRLPNKDELSLLYKNFKRQNISNFSGQYYWGSSECNCPYAWMYDFVNNILLTESKSILRSVRAVNSSLGLDKGKIMLLIKEYKNNNKELFEAQGEFETIQEFEIRNTKAKKELENITSNYYLELDRKKANQKIIEEQKLKQEEQDRKVEIAKSIQPIGLKIIEISRYDINKQKFEIKLENTLTYTIDVPLVNAPSFKNNYENIVFNGFI